MLPSTRGAPMVKRPGKKGEKRRKKKKKKKRNGEREKKRDILINDSLQRSLFSSGLPFIGI